MTKKNDNHDKMLFAFINSFTKSTFLDVTLYDEVLKGLLHLITKKCYKTYVNGT